jgi:hypothetical protein
LFYIRGFEKKNAVSAAFKGIPEIPLPSEMSSEEEKKEVYLEADKEIPGQHYVALSFISPEKVLANKDNYFFTEFLKDYEVQHKIAATENFLMSEVKKVQDYASAIQDVLETFTSKDSASKDEIESAFKEVKEKRLTLTNNVVADLEAYVKANMTDIKATKIQDAYETFLFKNRKRMEDDFFAKNNFRTTVRGLKVRGTYDTYNEALNRAKTLQKIDPSFNVYVGAVGAWLPWDPEPTDIANQEYADDQLNQLMKKYKENEGQRDEFYEQMKRDRIGEKNKSVTAANLGATQNTPSDMFAGEDLAIARKKELEQARAVADAVSKISHV